jgi:hypothetical protein
MSRIIQQLEAEGRPLCFTVACQRWDPRLAGQLWGLRLQHQELSLGRYRLGRRGRGQSPRRAVALVVFASHPAAWEAQRRAELLSGAYAAVRHHDAPPGRRLPRLAHALRLRTRNGLGQFVAAFPALQELSVRFWGTYAPEYRELVAHVPLSLRKLTIRALTMQDLAFVVNRLPILEDLRVTSTVVADGDQASPIEDASAECLVVDHDRKASTSLDRLSVILAVINTLWPPLARFYITLSDLGPHDSTRELAAESHFRDYFGSATLPILADCSITLAYSGRDPQGAYLVCQTLAFQSVEGQRRFHCSSDLRPVSVLSDEDTATLTQLKTRREDYSEGRRRIREAEARCFFSFWGITLCLVMAAALCAVYGCSATIKKPAVVAAVLESANISEPALL